MSRIVVKNLPKKISANKLQEIFSEKGQITDLQLKYAKNGVFRQFGFIGFKTEEEAKATKDFFHNTFIQTSKIKVEMCHSLGDDKAKAWSKYSKEKSTKKELDSEKRAKKEKAKAKEEKSEISKDPQFVEFLQVTGRRESKPLWCDPAEFGDDEKDQEPLNDDEDTSDDDDGGGGSSSDETGTPACRSTMSDIEYLRTKMKTSKNLPDNDKTVQEGKKVKAFSGEFTVKIKKLPYTCKKKHLKAFFLPLKPYSIRIPRGAKGFAYVGFSNEKDMKKALNKHRGFLEGNRVDVIIYKKKKEENASHPDTKEADNQDEDPLETVAETGRLFVRNLCFSVMEEELKELFAKHGPIAEIVIPTDFYTKEGLGYAFVTYVFAEHAVKAYTELDGSIFQGRLLHIIPGKPKKEVQLDPKEMTFKQMKAQKIKSLSHSSHNWNTLFLGLNAVTEAVAQKYGVSKAELLSNETKDSAAVRVALGETQLVIETRKFLIEHGVALDAFSQPAAERSKTVIIVKNLPAGTTSNQLIGVFSKHGGIKKVVLPPSGITALMEFEVPSDAKTAFSRLAYSRFGSQPLYLEWAPMNVFDTEPSKENTDEINEKSTTECNTLVEEGEGREKCEKTDDDDDAAEKEDVEEDEENKSDDDLPAEGTTLFVKNINFDTTEEGLKKHFQVCGPLYSVSISKKKDLKSGKLLSMGFGFVQYKQKSSAQTAIQDLQLSVLDGHTLELKYSHRATVPVATTGRKKAKVTKQKTSKICVRNIPFEAKVKEIRSLFEGFGELKFVRLPKKAGGKEHRGFGFVDFVSRSCAKKAFEALCHSTHLLGRRLVLEWAEADAEDVDNLRRKTARNFVQSDHERVVKKARLYEDAMFAKPADL